MGRQQADEDAAGPQQRKLLLFRTAHLEEDVGLGIDIGCARQRGAGGHELRIGDAGADAGAGLDDHGMAAASEKLLDRFRRGANTRFAGVNFGRDADAHRIEPLFLERKTRPGPNHEHRCGCSRSFYLRGGRGKLGMGPGAGDWGLGRQGQFNHHPYAPRAFNLLRTSHLPRTSHLEPPPLLQTSTFEVPTFTETFHTPACCPCPCLGAARSCVVRTTRA